MGAQMKCPVCFREKHNDTKCRFCGINKTDDVKSVFQFVTNVEKVIAEVKNQFPDYESFVYSEDVHKTSDYGTADIKRWLSVFYDFVEAIKCVHTLECRNTSCEPLFDAFIGGYAAGVLASVSSRGANTHRKILARILGKAAIRERWNKSDEKKNELAELADKMWKEGSLLLHNEMAEELRNTNPDAASILSKPSVLKAIKPVAHKHGKVRGTKGVRKEKLPPK